jgi:hypothetical protein
MTWLEHLKAFVNQRPIVALRFGLAEWTALRDSRKGVREFSVTYPHAALDRVTVPTVCLLEGESANGPEMYVAILQSKNAVSTLQSRIKVRRGAELLQPLLSDVVLAIADGQYARRLEQRLEGNSPVVALSPLLSEHVVDALAADDSNAVALRAIHASLAVPARFDSMLALQDDAVRTALNAFEVEFDEAMSVNVSPNHETAVRRISVSEDAVIEHDARSLPGFDLTESDVTGRAVFRRADERIEVITANKRPLEEIFGVDLILVNLVHENVVMLQYKMLEPVTGVDFETDWLYRPDAQLDEELARMRVFGVDLGSAPGDYRYNHELFYLKFVKRDRSVRKGAIITPLSHFDMLRSDPALKGPRGGMRISYRSLGGRYLREMSFLDLVRAGYIGARANTTEQLRPLINAGLERNRGIVAAVRMHVANREGNARVDQYLGVKGYPR